MNSKPATTEEQDKAIKTRDCSVVLASGAGCGKTFVLIQRYLEYLEKYRVGQIVAITFTERAAREMRKRIRNELKARLAEAQASDSAESIWQQHLQDLEQAAITTIHGFSARVLREHARTAGIDPSFVILDDALASPLRGDTLQSSLRALLTSTEPAGDDLRDLIVLYGWQAVVIAIDEFLRDPAEAEWQAWLQQSPEDVAAGWHDHEQSSQREFVERAVQPTTPFGRALKDLQACERPANAEAARVIDMVLSMVHQLPVGLEEWIDLAKVGRKGERYWGSDHEGIKKVFETLRKEGRKAFESFAQPQDEAKIIEAARVGQRFLRVTMEVHREYQRVKHQAGMLDFQDLLVLARNLIRDHAQIREDLHSRYQMVMLDELQDTDPVQMEFVNLLCAAETPVDRMFAVGDRKQSIYRFRGAEVSLFDALRQSVPDAGRLDLTRNFRSRPGVIDFVNALCKPWFIDDAALVADRDDPLTVPAVEFQWCFPREEDEGQENKKESVAAIRAREADAIARRIAELLADETPRVVNRQGLLERVRAGDIVLLFRAMTSVAIYEAALRRYGIHYYLVGGRAFYAQQEVYDLMNLARAVENPHDGLSLIGVLRSPFCNLSDEAIHLVGTHPDGVWAGLAHSKRWQGLPNDEKATILRARTFLEALRAQKDLLPVAQLLRNAMESSGYDAALQWEFLGDRKLANLWKLIDQARDFDRMGYGLPEFVLRLTDLVERLHREEQAATQPENADVVRIMSVHQAKGLEFPVVFVPDIAAIKRTPVTPVAHWHRELGCLARLPGDFTDEEKESEDAPFSDWPYQYGKRVESLAEEQEGLRVFYVACTRARDCLILSAGLPDRFEDGDPPLPPKSGNGPWITALSQRFHVLTGRCVDADMPVQVHVRCVEPSDTPVPAAALVTEAPAAHPFPRWAEVSPTRTRWVPRIVSLPALIRFGNGLPVETLAVTDSPDDHGLSPHSTASTEDLFRSACAAWDFHNPRGWEPILESHPSLARRHPDLRPMLVHLAAFLEAHPSTSHQREMQFLVNLADHPDASGKPYAAVQGTLDLVLEDGDGHHLVQFDALGEADDSEMTLQLAALAFKSVPGARVWLHRWNVRTGEASQQMPDPVAASASIRQVCLWLDAWQ